MSRTAQDARVQSGYGARLRPRCQSNYTEAVKASAHPVLPSRKEFLTLAKNHTLVPVCRTLTADLETPVSAFLRAAWPQPECFLLESVENGEQVGRYTFIGLAPFKRIVARGRKIVITEGKKVVRIEGDIFAELRRALGGHKPARLPGLPPFTAGAVGFFSYDAVRQIERLPELAADELGVPDACLLFFDEVLAFDHVRKEIWLVVTADLTRNNPSDAYDKAVLRLDKLEKRLAQPLPTLPSPHSKGKLKVNHRTAKKDFLAAVDRTKEYIAAGDIFQAVLSQRFDVVPEADSFQVYRALRTVNPSPYMYFLRFTPEGPLGGHPDKSRNSSKKSKAPTAQNLELAGSSPELLVRVHQGKVEYRPIAGTRPRGANEEEDQALADEMLHDEKERAEHVMLVGPADVRRALLACHAYSQHHRGAAPPGADRRRCIARLLPRRNPQRRAQSPGHGDHRGAGAGAARNIRRRRALRGFLRQPRLLHRHPLHAGHRRQGIRPGRSRHRSRLGARVGTPGIAQ